jgi:hypothetical protein
LSKMILMLRLGIIPDARQTMSCRLRLRSLLSLARRACGIGKSARA